MTDQNEKDDGEGTGVCPECRGSGEFQGMTCPRCDGSGKLVEGIGG